jgi:hypothetical protein
MSYQFIPIHTILLDTVSSENALRRHAASSRPRINPPHWTTVESRMTECWSPEQIVAGAGISHEHIYIY